MLYFDTASANGGISLLLKSTVALNSPSLSLNLSLLSSGANYSGISPFGSSASSTSTSQVNDRTNINATISLGNSFDADQALLSISYSVESAGFVSILSSSARVNGVNTAISPFSQYNFNSPTLGNEITNQIATQGSPFSFVVPADTFSDTDPGDTIAYSATKSDGTALPSWLSFASSTKTFTGTPSNGDVGNLAVKVIASDRLGLSASDVFSINVANINDAPVFANVIDKKSGSQGTAFSYQVPTNIFSDIDVGDTLSYTATTANGDPLPSWLSFDASTRTFSGTPANGDVGTLNLKVIATDTSLATANTTFDLVIANINDVPTVANPIADQLATKGNNFNFVVPTSAFNDVDVGDTLAYSATKLDGTALPSWLSFNRFTQTFSGTPTNIDVGLLSVKVTASDSSSAYANDIFDIVVETTDPAINGAANKDTLNGTGGDDRIFGLAGDDKLTSLSGNDLLDGGLGADTMIGGSGNDTYFVDNAKDKVTEAKNAGTDTVITSTSSYTLGNYVENLSYNGGGNFTGIGNSDNNSITGGTVADILKGMKGNDTLTGNTGNDRFIFAAGDTTLNGYDRIVDFALGDVVDYAKSLVIGGSSAKSITAKVSINQNTGVATFAAGSGLTLTDALSDIAANFTSAKDAAGEYAVFQVGGAGDLYMMISDGKKGYGANDAVIQFDGLTTSNIFVSSSGNLGLAAG